MTTIKPTPEDLRKAEETHRFLMALTSFEESLPSILSEALDRKVTVETSYEDNFYNSTLRVPVNGNPYVDYMVVDFLYDEFRSETYPEPYKVYGIRESGTSEPDTYGELVSFRNTSQVATYLRRAVRILDNSRKLAKIVSQNF